MQQQGHLDKKQANLDESVPSIVAAGAASIVQANRAMRAKNSTAIKGAVKRMVKDTAKIQAESRARRLEIEKQVIIQLVEEKMKCCKTLKCSVHSRGDAVQARKE